MISLVPEMPRRAKRHQRHRSNTQRATYNACVARPVSSKETQSNPKALLAKQAEWDRLRAVPRPDGGLGVWDETLVTEWRTVKRKALQEGRKIHIGRVFDIIVEKNSELVESDPKRKFKGRAVFGGNDVHDEVGNWAIFQDLGSCPATMEAARAADAYGCMPGHSAEQCDAEQAYTQAVLVGTETWVRLPRDQWPASWSAMHDPVVPLRLALYGHPDSGGHWERHCERHLKEAGYEPVPNWRSTFWHPRLRLYLVVYVDDFKLSGPTENLQEGWALIRRNIKTDDPHPPDLFLGCRHNVFERTLPDTGVKVRGIEYDMSDFLRSCVERYKELTGVVSLRKAATPFLPEPTKPDFSHCEAGPLVEPTPCEALQEVMDCIGGQGTRTLAAGTPKATAKQAEEVDNPDIPEQLTPYAAKVLVKILYAARYARLDLLRAVCALAQRVSRWDRECDIFSG